MKITFGFENRNKNCGYSKPLDLIAFSVDIRRKKFWTQSEL